MDFNLNDVQKAMAETAERFAKKDIPRWLEQEGSIREMIRKMGEVGFFGCAFPPRYGGSQAGFLAHSLVCEKISQADSGLRAPFNLQAMTVPYTILEWATDQARQEYITPLVSGERLGCTCFSEPNVGSDLAAMETKVEEVFCMAKGDDMCRFIVYRPED